MKDVMQLLIVLLLCAYFVKPSVHRAPSRGLVDFVIGLVISILKLPDGQMKFFEGIQITEKRYPMLNPKFFFGLVEMTFGLVSASYSLPE